MTEFKWNFDPLEAYPEKDEMTDVVFLVHWQLTGTRDEYDKTYSNTIIGTQTLPLPEGYFIPFEELTTEIVLQWITEEMGQERIDAMYQSIEQNIDEQINPKTIKLHLK